MKYGRLILILTVCFGNIYAQKNTIDSLEKALPSTPDEKKIEVYQKIITTLWLNQPDAAMRYANKTIEFTETRSSREKAIANRLKGAVFFYIDQYDSAIKYNYYALLFSEQAKDSLLIANSMNNVGLAFFEVGSYPKALEYLLKSYQIKTRIKGNTNIPKTLNNIGLVYNELKQYSRARDYFERALELGKDDENQIYSFNNIGLSYLNEGSLTEASENFTKAKNLRNPSENAVDGAITLCGLGRVATESGDLRLARKYFNESLRIRESIKEPGGLAEIYFYYSSVYKKLHKTDSALYFIRKSESLARQVHANDITILCYNALSKLFFENKRFDSAYFYQSKFIIQRDSLFDENLARNINNVQLEIQDEESSAKLGDKDREIESRKNFAYFVSAFAILLMIFAFGFYRSRNRERKLKNDLSQKNNQVEQQKEELLLSNEQLAKAHEVISKQNAELAEYNVQLQTTVDNRTKELELANNELSIVNLELDNFIYRSSHDIKGPLVRLIGLCHVALLDVSDQKAKEYLMKLSESARNLSEIFDRLRTVSDINSITLSKERIEFSEMILKIKSRLKMLDGFNEITFKEDIEKMEFQSDPILLETIFHNMIENAIKFQKKSSEFNKFISIKVKRQNGSVHVSFIDNGIGIRSADTKEIFNMFTNAALEHKTVGLGLYIVKQCAAKLNGTVRIVPNANQYTEFELTLPFIGVN
ncbi:MAG: tetratricopeptide repeat-containing sensor histidine kinase [Cyclobacteriaceae bacterium]